MTVKPTVKTTSTFEGVIVVTLKQGMNIPQHS